MTKIQNGTGYPFWAKSKPAGLPGRKPALQEEILSRFARLNDKLLECRLEFGAWNFEFVSNFEFRASDLQDILSGLLQVFEKFYTYPLSNFASQGHGGALIGLVFVRGFPAAAKRFN